MIPIFLLSIENDNDRTFMINLYLKYNKLMFVKAKEIVKDDYVAEDMVQETFAKLIEKIEKIRKIERCILPSYLVICIRRVCFNYLRKKQVREKYSAQSMDNEAFHFEYEDDKTNVEAEVLLKLDVSEVKKTFLKLPEKLQNVLEYKYLFEMTDEEIAKTLGINKNSVRTYLTRARREVYKRMKEDDNDRIPDTI